MMKGNFLERGFAEFQMLIRIWRSKLEYIHLRDAADISDGTKVVLKR